MKPMKKLLLSLLSLTIFGGCSSVNFDHSLDSTNQRAAAFTQGKLTLIKTADQRSQLDGLVTEMLRSPLSQTDAVQIALANSAALQALLAQHWADAAQTAQNGRISNPIFSFERIRFADELEWGRLLSFGLLELLTLPQRYQLTQGQLAKEQLQLTSQVIDQVTQIRQSWVKAVAAQQSLIYARQINEAAQASAELARRMQAVGNFNKLQRARQQAFYAEAIAQLAIAQHASVAAREELVRYLGLNDVQAKQMRLPDRLPDLPKTPLLPEEMGRLASKERLDIQLAQTQYENAAKAQGLTVLSSLTDIEMGLRRDTVLDQASHTSLPKRGYELSIRLPVFDGGGLRRDAMNAQTLAAANRLEATLRAASSSLRENYSAYRTSLDVAKHYRDEIVPLRKSISEENLLRYNGMLIGVFELLADTREQINSVMAAIAAEQQFWLSEAALQASLIGKPTIAAVNSIRGSASSENGAGH